ncbi:MAG: ABC transporter permease [Acidobacteriota bacterium]|nr:ABC transporter permease [Acidobacteriota bacterium]
MIFQDLRYTLRQMRKSPVFTLVAVVTLALGIGANTAIFTLLDQALLRALPVSHPEQLVRLQFTGSTRGHFNSFGGDDHDYFSYPMYRDLRDQNSVFESLIASDLQNVSVTWNNRPELVGCELASSNYFQALGLKPALGRLFVPGDDVPNSAPVVVLSFNYWKRQFGSDPGVINHTLSINAHPFTIIGVAPPGFHSLSPGATSETFVPLTTKNVITPRWQDLEDFNSHWMMIVGRLKPGVSRTQAEAGLQPLWHALRAAELATIPNASERLRRTYLDESHLLLLDSARGFSPLRDQIATPVMIVMGMVVLLVLMASVNVSSLLLVRAAGRVREMSVRYAMGAGRWQIVRQLLAEGLLLGLMGGALGLVIAPAVSSLLMHRIAGDTATELPFSSSIDVRVLLFNFALALAVSLLFSLAPALRFLHPDLAGSLKQQSTTSAGGQLRFRRVLVAAQIGLSLLLLVGAGLFVRTLHNLRNVDVGFATDHLISFGINPRLSGYQTEQVFPLYRRVLQTLSALPGTRAVAGTDDPDLANTSDDGNIVIAGYQDRDEEDMQVEMPAATPGYFAAMQTPLLAGRDFTDDDVADSPKVAVVNLAFARRYFGTPQNALGRFLSFGGHHTKADTEIVGVVGDTRHARVRDDVKRTVYRPRFQLDNPSGLFFQLRTWQSPEAALSGVRVAMQQLDSKLALIDLRTMDAQIADNLSVERLIALLAVSFGVLAMLLAAIGLYGVLAYATAQRTREIGIRMALGAQRTGVVRLVLQDVLWLAGISIVVTLPLALLLARMLRSQLYGVSAADPLTLAGGTLLVALVALLAALLPARRAATIEPMKALRME